MIGQTVDQYKVIESLGRNPVAETFLAEHTLSGERFVLKMVTPQLLVLAGFKDRLLADVSNMIDWHHPRVMPIENILDENGRLFLVQRYVACESLAKVIRAETGPFPMEHFDTIAGDVLNGLAFLHGQGVVPRFFNPRKIMVTPDGRAFLRIMGKELPKALETYRKKQNLVPAARFFAPERFENPETQDVRHNIYSMGIVLFQMATGKIPYGGKTYEELQQRHGSSRIPSPRKVNPAVSAELSDTILRAMAKRPQDRFQSVEELAAALGVAPDDVGAGTVMNAGASVGMLADEPSFGMDLMSESDAQALDDRPEEFDFSEDDGFGNDGADGDGFDDDLDFDSGPATVAGDAFAMGPAPTSDGLGFDQGDAGDDFGAGDDFSGGGDFDFNAPPAPTDDAFNVSGSDAYGATPPASENRFDDADDDGFDFGSPDPVAPGDAALDFTGGGPDGLQDFDLDTPAPETEEAPDAAFQFDGGKDFGSADFDFGAEPAGPQMGAPTLESDAYSRPEPASGNFTLGELDNHDPTALEAAFDRELGKEDDNPFSSLDMDAPEDDDPFSALGINRDEPPPPDPGGDVLDLDATNPDEGFDFGSEFDAPAGPADDEFGFETPSADAGGFDFGNDAPGGGGDDFGFGNDAPAGGGDAFGFGDDAPAGDDFGFGNDAPAGGDDFGFGNDAPAGGDDFGFGDDAPAGGDDFGFGNDTPAGGDDFGFGNDAPAAGDDFGFGDDAPAGGGDDFGFGNDAPGGGGDAFGFGDDASAGGDAFGFGDADGGDAFGFESEGAKDDFGFGDPAPAGDGGFNFEPEAADDFGFDAPAGGGSEALDEFGLPIEDPASARRATPPPPPASGTDAGGTDDGAFSFEVVEDEPPPPPPPPSSEAAAGLAGSLAAAEAATATPKTKPKKAKVVRRFDMRVVGVTAVLGLLVVAAAGYLYFSSQRKKHDRQIMQAVQGLADANQFDKALDRIDGELGKDPSDALAGQLRNLADAIRREQEETKNQVETLLARGLEYENTGKALTDGVNDAMGAYARALEKDPANTTAREAVIRIKEEKSREADTALEAGNDLEALAMLGALVAADGTDKELKTRYQTLKTRLADEKSGALRNTLEKLFSEARYEEMVAPLTELDQITPGDKFVKDMRRNLVDAFVSKGQELASRQKFEEAEKVYSLAGELDPKDAKVEAALKATKEQRLLSRIQDLQRSLSKAINDKNLVDQFKFAKELSTLDPGNYTATSAMEVIEKAVSGLLADAEAARERGQFKQAAKLYKEIYDINGDPDIFALYDQYQKWAPPPGMSFLPISTFKRGDRGTANARPEHRVTVSNFFLDKYEVTNRQYLAFVEANPRWAPDRIDAGLQDGNYLRHWVAGKPKPDDLDRPVVYVSWFAAKAYAEWQRKRLPTEAEWEKAARGNLEGKNFWWGDYSDAKKAVYDLYPERRPAPVGSFPANPFDVHEILGNVNEWVEDTYDPDFYDKTQDARDPVNDANGAEKVLRGGSYKSRGRELAAFLRYHKDPRFCHATVGFRCARDAGDIH